MRASDRRKDSSSSAASGLSSQGLLVKKNSPADSHAGTGWRARGVPQCEDLVLAVVVVIVPAYVVVMSICRCSILGTLLTLPHIGLP